MKFKVGDKVVRTEVCPKGYEVKQGKTYVVQRVSNDLGVIYLEGVFNSEGNLSWFMPNNFELVKENTPKFKKGDKVTIIGAPNNIGIENVIIGSCGIVTAEGVETSNLLVQSEGCLNTTKDFYFTPKSLKHFEQVDKNYRHLSPDTLIPISIDGVESEVPLGDLVHATALLGMTNGTYGCRLWTKLEGLFDNDDVIGDSYSSVIKFEEQKVLFSKFFLDPKKEQQKENIKKTILVKETELKELQNQLKELD